VTALPIVCCKLVQSFGAFVQITTFTVRVKSAWISVMRVLNAAVGTPAATRSEFAFCKIASVALTTWTIEAAAAPASVTVPVVRLVTMELIPFPAPVKIVLIGAGAAPAMSVIAVKTAGMAPARLLIAAWQPGVAVGVGIDTAGVVTAGVVTAAVVTAGVNTAGVNTAGIVGVGVAGVFKQLTS